MRFLLAALIALAPVAGAGEPREVEIVVQDGRYQPAEVVAKEGEALRLRFLRKEWSGCTAEVVFPTLDIRVQLPPEETVLIDLPALPVGETPFHCGMKMVHGKIVVEAK